ncbi:MAG: STAS domain-containing protein [Candidatus Omnitrophica bacterium]|nr:STAS domain-containing protein [Candidatus Omnitrophota bacterium]
MYIHQREKNGVLICSIGGELTIDTVGELKKTFKILLGNKWSKIVFNLEKLDYIDSSGLAALVEFSIDLKAIQGVMILASLPPKIRSIFGITKLEKMFTICETEEEALGSL